MAENPVLRTLRLRPMEESDIPFLRRLYGSTRTEELSVLDWTAQQKEEFLDMQFHAQHTYYRAVYGQAEFLVVILDGERAGRLYLDRREDEIRIVDIALLPGHRNLGVGTSLLADLLEEAEEKNLPVRIHVENYNPALRLYGRLEFQRVGETGVYHLLEWRPRSLRSAENGQAAP